jgi:hypothetical protein
VPPAGCYLISFEFIATRFVSGEGLTHLQARHDETAALLENNEHALRSWRLWRYRTRLQAELLDAQALKDEKQRDTQVARVQAAIDVAKEAAAKLEQEIATHLDDHKKKRDSSPTAHHKSVEPNPTTESSDSDSERERARLSRRERKAEAAVTEQLLSALSRVDRKVPGAMRVKDPDPPLNPWMPAPPVQYEPEPERIYYDVEKPGSVLLHAALTGGGVQGSQRAIALYKAKGLRKEPKPDQKLSALAAQALDLPAMPAAAAALEASRVGSGKRLTGSLRQDAMPSDAPALRVARHGYAYLNWTPADSTNPSVPKPKRYSQHLSKVAKIVEAKEQASGAGGGVGNARAKRQPK